MSNLDILITFIPGGISLGLGIIVYTENKKNLSNKVFGGLCLALILWAGANYFSLHPVWFSALFWVRLVMFFAVFLQFMFFMFVYLFPQNRILMSKLKFSLLVFLTSATMLAGVSPFLYLNLNEEAVPVPGPLMPLFAFTIFLFWGLSVFYVVKKYYLSKDIEKTQWRLIMLGFLSMFILLIFSQFLSVIIFKDTGFIKFGPLFTLPFIVLSTYAIIRRQLLNVKVIATESLIGLLLIVLLAKILLSVGVKELSLNLGFFITVAFLGVLLIKAVSKEIQDKIRIENLAGNLKSANIRLKKLDQAKSEFISIASHQLRTPLAAIKGYISMLKEGSYGPLSEKQAGPMDNVFQSNERLIKLVNDLLNLSRLEAGKLEFKPESASLKELISGVVEELKINANKKGLYLKIENPEISLPKIIADVDKLRQVFLNIIDNAIKYTEKGGITIKAKILNTKYQIQISDTGDGIAKEEIENLFQMFLRGSAGSQSQGEGSGVGLYVAKKFVEMHRGKIWAESAGKGKGSTFFIELPIRR